MSRFVSGGSDEKPTERSQEWLQAQQAIEAKQLTKKLESQQQDGKSLYDTLQANKAAKEDAFQESIKLTNQFRALDDDEIEFLESVHESTRAKETAVRRETAQELSRFREEREKVERAARAAEPGDEAPAVSQEAWAVSKKRKREKGGAGLLGVKLRKASSGAEVMPNVKAGEGDAGTYAKVTRTSEDKVAKSESSSVPSTAVAKAPAQKPSLGLADYSSDED